MKVTLPGSDYIVLDDHNINECIDIPKIHLIKICLSVPSTNTVCSIIQKFSKTNRFIIEDNIKFYNDIFKHYSKKFYVENKSDDRLISFFRKNNKVLLNVCNLNFVDEEFIRLNIEDVLRNIEVIQLTTNLFRSNDYYLPLENWRGNVIITDPENL